jgi:hypothetical protein
MHRLGAVQFLLFGFLVAGCSDTLTVGGTVTYEGAPIKEGQISFVSPAVTAGAPITDGKYQLVGKLKPGKYTVNITGVLKSATSNEPLKSGDSMPPSDPIPDMAVGNGQSVEITGSKADLNFDLKKPAK